MDWIMELGLAIVRMFMQPFMYLFFLLIFLSGYWRIKKDRQHHGAKVYPYFYEVRQSVSVTVIIGLLLSIVSVALGFIVSLPFVLLLGAVLLVLSLANHFSVLSAAHGLAITAMITYVLNRYGSDYVPEAWLQQLDTTNLFYIPIIIAILLFAEAWYVKRINADDTFPELSKSGRGKFIGQHRIKKLTIIPFIALFPVGSLESFVDWWPVFEIGQQSFGLIVVPYLLGFEYVVKTSLVRTATDWIAPRITLLAALVLLLAAGSYFVPFLTMIALAAALIGKEIVQYLYRAKEQQERPYFQPSDKGLFVLGTLPDSPAVDLGLQPGEEIMKVNDQVVRNEDHFYQAVNNNRAFCKLSVKDLEGELRFAQRALYEGEHHKLGILFVKETNMYQETIKQES
ncbi:PDZ domain-containing protein [Gracilibacillus caseinilyticus]|uniref:PDZ domain-containing protein n=1 Tax=Gracilibacillus caseinilyticus TaxID=2932256 RepID=A0ABY4EWN9_9BACI|nr:PDZ domain-containing protein [Gracilibacillus caseinilyticus]UOQ48273.1 PDZ domain-containing protein [Gracilibacillus caseinilyticus]